ncbi:MAG: hypothetical protein FJ404_10315 [Verrucomicrobia bacterium]|nr:hypothetical protein [Verrucomicrobiota bacterium]
MKVKEQTPKTTSKVNLAKGQLWQIGAEFIEILEVGKTLTHYKHFRDKKRVPISLGGIQVVQDYLRNNKAKLVRKTVQPKARS